MKKHDLVLPPFYEKYVALVRNVDLIEALEKSSATTKDIVAGIAEKDGDYAYAPGKWTIRELLTHMLDAERIFAYRALCFSRNDSTPLPGFDENAYVPESNAKARSIGEINRSFELLRLSTIDLFKSFSDTMLERTGVANNSTISVRAIGYVIAGHETHHCNILRERYLKRQ